MFPNLSGQKPNLEHGKFTDVVNTTLGHHVGGACQPPSIAPLGCCWLVNVSWGSFFFDLLQTAMREGRVPPNETARPALARRSASGTLYLARKGCLPPVISMSSSRSSMQRAGQPVLRETPGGKTLGVRQRPSPVSLGEDAAGSLLSLLGVLSPPELGCFAV